MSVDRGTPSSNKRPPGGAMRGHGPMGRGGPIGHDEG